MRWILFVGVVTGCGFSVPGAPGGDSTGTDPGNAGDIDAGLVAATCDVTDPSVRLCITFDGQPMVQDLSTHPHAITTLMNSVSLIQRDGSPAAAFSAKSRVLIPESSGSDLNLPELTIEMWIAPQLPIAHNASYWMLDNNTEYFASFEDSQKVRCGIGNQTVDSDTIINDPNWHHVACTYKPGVANQMGQLITYLDGKATCNMARAVPTGGMDGTAIGDNHGKNSDTDFYLGGLDNLHVYNRALSPTQICTNAQQTSCDAGCAGDPINQQ